MFSSVVTALLLSSVAMASMLFTSIADISSTVHHKNEEFLLLRSTGVFLTVVGFDCFNMTVIPKNLYIMINNIIVTAVLTCDID